MECQHENEAVIVPAALLRPLVDFYRPSKVILFGSKSRGDDGPDSDFDLFVIVDDDIPADKLSWRARYEARKSFHQAVDIVTCRERVYRDNRLVIGTLSHTADTQGTVVYARP